MLPDATRCHHSSSTSLDTHPPLNHHTPPSPSKYTTQVLPRTTHVPPSTSPTTQGQLASCDWTIAELQRAGEKRSGWKTEAQMRDCSGTVALYGSDAMGWCIGEVLCRCAVVVCTLPLYVLSRCAGVEFESSRVESRLWAMGYGLWAAFRV